VQVAAAADAEEVLVWAEAKRGMAKREKKVKDLNAIVKM